MLQSVPDPFDSYGQQPSEDQIFSILPPLSIMAAASPSPSPLSSTPQTEASDIFATGTTAWGPPPAALYTDTSTEWADATSPSPSTSPTASASPRSSSPSHRVHRPASPPNSRRTESKLRSVLAVIDEVRNRTLAIAPATNGGTNGSGNRNGIGNGIGTNSGASTSTGTPSSLSSSGLDAPPAPDAASDVRAARDARISSWAAFPFASYASRPGSEETTPRGSTFFAPAVPPDPDPAPDVERERERGRGRSPQSDETATITAVAAASAASASAS